MSGLWYFGACGIMGKKCENGTIKKDGFVKIFRSEGVRGLYSGLTPTLVMAIPSTVTYFTMYDWLRDRLNRWEHLNDITTPLLAGNAFVACFSTFFCC